MKKSTLAMAIVMLSGVLFYTLPLEAKDETIDINSAKKRLEEIFNKEQKDTSSQIFSGKELLSFSAEIKAAGANILGFNIDEERNNGKESANQSEALTLQETIAKLVIFSLL